MVKLTILLPTVSSDILTWDLVMEEVARWVPIFLKVHLDIQAEVMISKHLVLHLEVTFQEEAEVLTEEATILATFSDRREISIIRAASLEVVMDMDLLVISMLMVIILLGMYIEVFTNRIEAVIILRETSSQANKVELLVQCRFKISTRPEFFQRLMSFSTGFGR